jgi:hypothetical protein
MNTLKIPCEPGEVSDGFHTFNELYQHRTSLILALIKAHPEISWISLKHDDGSAFDDWFIAGMDLPTGTVTYHLCIGFWTMAKNAGAKVLERAPKWDGHTSNDVLNRIQLWIVDYAPGRAS